MKITYWVLITVFFISKTNAVDKEVNKPTIHSILPRFRFVQRLSYDASVVRQIEEIVRTYSVTIFSKSYCSYSKQAKDILFKYNLRNVGVFELDQQRLDATVYQDALERLTGARTVPRVFIGGKFVGGADQISALHQSGSLWKLLKDAGAIF